jgi:hypothetical protein
LRQGAIISSKLLEGLAVFGRENKGAEQREPLRSRNCVLRERLIDSPHKEIRSASY